jgi:hypothetical protein
LQNLQTLSCPKCGAPLPTTSNMEIITCDYCGTAQQRVDVEKYIDQLRADVYGWVRTIIPSASMTVTTVDPVARAQIFEQNIRGEVTSRLGSINTQLLKIGSLPLFVPPYAKSFQSTALAGSVDSKEMLAQAAKFQGLMPFAQSEDQTSFVTEAAIASETLGYLSNVMRIYADSGPRSYRTVSKNFEGATTALEKDKSRSGAALRMKGLASMSEGTALVIEGDLTDAEKKLAEANTSLTSAMSEVMRQPSIASWYPGIKAEKGMAESMKCIVDAVKASRTYSQNHMEALAKYEAYVKSFESAKSSAGKLLYSGDQLDPETFKELSTFFRDVSQAKAGNPFVNAIGTRGIFVACWLAAVSYSFETGALFMKKGQAVQERLLVSGTFTTMPQYISSQPQVLVTDIFSVRSESSFTDRFMGREKTLTTGVGYSALGSATKGSIPSGSLVIPPLSTRMEAEKMANIYLERVRQKMQGKLRIGIPSITGLVYVGGTIDNGWLVVPGLPNSMFPYVGDQRTLEVYSV